MIVPKILPGVISGGLFAFVISFDEVVCVIFLAGFEQLGNLGNLVLRRRGGEQEREQDSHDTH